MVDNGHTLTSMPFTAFCTACLYWASCPSSSVDLNNSSNSQMLAPQALSE